MFPIVSLFLFRTGSLDQSISIANKCGALTSSEVEERNGAGALVARILQGLRSAKSAAISHISLIHLIRVTSSIRL